MTPGFHIKAEPCRRARPVRSPGRWSFILGLGWLLAFGSLQAHTASTGFLQGVQTNRTVALQLELPLRDLDDLLGLDANDDGQLSWGELKVRQADLAAYVRPRLRLLAGDDSLPLEPAGLLVSQRNGEGNAVLRFSAKAPEEAVSLALRYEVLFDQDPLHRCLVSWASGPNGEATTTVLSPELPVSSFSLIRPAPLRLSPFLREGVHHIWTGYDHLLFLLALLLPAVLYRTSGGWAPAPTFRGVLTDVLKVVTAFTLAHSLTLALAALEIVRLPSRLVESTIAASIIVAALANLWPARRNSGVGPADRSGGRFPWLVPWKVAFVFGLIHGFGFAGVLGELGLQRSRLAVPLFGFNVGVELGQLACVALFLPLAFLLRTTRFYRGGALPVGSLGIAVLAGAWLVERAFALSFMPF